MSTNLKCNQTMVLLFENPNLCRNFSFVVSVSRQLCREVIPLTFYIISLNHIASYWRNFVENDLKLVQKVAFWYPLRHGIAKFGWTKKTQFWNDCLENALPRNAFRTTDALVLVCWGLWDTFKISLQNSWAWSANISNSGSICFRKDSLCVPWRGFFQIWSLGHVFCVVSLLNLKKI